MTTNMAPKFGKVELLIKNGSIGVDNLVFEDCGLMITGDYLIVIIDERDELKNTATSTGKIFKLSEIKSYKTHKI